MKQRVFNLIVLDESGSMSAIEKQAIDGVNETVQNIRQAGRRHKGQEHFVTLVTFNSDRIKTVYNCIDARKVEELSSHQYRPACCTPLYDAMGMAINNLKKKVAETDAVLVTIITDGEENSSREYNAAAIKRLVESLKASGWTFTYIGANQDVVQVARTISITNTLEFCAEPEETKAMFECERKARGRWLDKLACSCSPKEMNDGYFDED